MINAYSEKKEKGIITVSVRDGGGLVDNDLVVQTKQFDPETGLETEPKVDQYSKKVLQENKEELEKKLADVNAMLQEFDS